MASAGPRHCRTDCRRAHPLAIGCMNSAPGLTGAVLLGLAGVAPAFREARCLNIVFVHRGVYPERIGGTYAYIHELTRRLAAMGHGVDVIASTREAALGPPTETGGVTIHRYHFRRLNPVLSTLQHLHRTLNICRRIAGEKRIDILSIHESQLGWRLARSELGRSVCQVPTFHAPVFLEFRLNTFWRIESERSLLRRAALRITERPLEHWQRRFEGGVLEAAQGILVLSEYSKSHIRNHFPSVDLGRARVIPSGVDTERFHPHGDKGRVRAELGLDARAVYLITVRNLNPRMGLENLIAAMPQVLANPISSGVDLKLLICGEGQLRQRLRQQIDGLGLGSVVRLVGRVSDEDLPKYYQAADLFVLPTQAMEGFGIVTVEALSANLPVLGTPAGATPEILRPVDDRLVTDDTSQEAIAGGIVSWLGWREEDAGTTRYRDEVLAKYSWRSVADRVESYYAEMSAAFERSR